MRPSSTVGATPVPMMGRRALGEEVTVEDDEVRVAAGDDPAAPVLREGRGAEPAVYASSAAFDPESLAGQPATLGVTVQPLLARGPRCAAQETGRTGRPASRTPTRGRPPTFRIERHAQARLARSAPRLARPGDELVARRDGMARLHRGHHAQRREARDVGRVKAGRRALPVAAGVRAGRDRSTMGIARPRPVRGSGGLVSVERHPDPAVADGVELDLQPRRSASVTNAVSISGSQFGSPVDVSSS